MGCPSLAMPTPNELAVITPFTTDQKRIIKDEPTKDNDSIDLPLAFLLRLGRVDQSPHSQT